MGGFATRPEPNTIQTVNPGDQFLQGTVIWPNVDIADINDKSNGDSFTKMFVVWQTTWFVIQLGARVAERLAVTELEIMTLAYALSCALLYALWWDKPYNVHTPFIVGRQPSYEHRSHNQSQLDAHKQSSENSTNTGDNIKQTPSLLLFQGVLNREWIVDLDRILFGGADKYSSKKTRGWDERAFARCFFVTSATIFGCIHCIPWNFRFPTTLERTMWIVSALIIAGAPLIMGSMSAVVDLSIKQLLAFDRASSPPRPRHIIVCNVILAMITMMLQFIHLVLVIAYCLARFILLVQGFVLLRNLSPSAAQSITWSRLIPHV